MSYSNAAYSNTIALVPSVQKRSAIERRAAASEGRSAEAILKSKIEKANSILDRLEARAAAQAEALKQLQKRKAATLARIERIEDAILTRMEDAGVTKIAGIRCSMESRPAAPALEIVDESLVPRIYFNTPKLPATVDKVALKKFLNSSDELDPKAFGCRLKSKISLIRK